MMTFILVVSALLIALIGLLRYDIHKHKYRVPANDNEPGDAVAQSADADERQPENKA